MAAAPTFDDIVDAGRREIITSPTRFDPDIVDVPGSDVNVLVNASAAMSEEVAAFVQRGLNELSLATAQDIGGEVLDRWVYDRYGLGRFSQTVSVGQVTLTRTAGVGPLIVDAGSVFGTEDAQTFESLSAISFGSGTETFSVRVFARTAGEGGNVEAGAINQVVSSFPGETLSVTNAERAVGGFPRETDEEFADRARNFFINARRATTSALVNGALDVPQVSFATPSENLDPDGNPAFRVSLTISDRDGQANLALGDLVRESLSEFRALGTPVQIILGNPQYVDIVIDGLQFAAGAVTTTVIAQVRGQILSLVNNIFPNRTLERGLIFQAIKNVPGTVMPESALISPPGDLIPTSGSVIRTTESRISINGNVV